MAEETQNMSPYGEPVGFQSDVESKVKHYASVLRRHIWPILAVFVVVSTLGILRAYRATPIYLSEARILVEREMPRVTKFEDVIQPSVGWWGQEYYKTQEELVRSRSVLEIALEQADIRALFETKATDHPRPSWRARLHQTFLAVLGVPLPEPPETWEKLRAYVQAKQVTDTHFVAVRVEDADPERAARIANAVARAFVRYHTVRRLEINNDVFVYLQEQKQKEEVALREAEQNLQRFREETNISSLDASDKDHPVLKRLGVLNEQLTEKQLARIDLEAQYRVVKQAYDRGGSVLEGGNEQLFSIPAMREDSTVAEIRKSLVMAEEEKATLADTYGPEHPRMQSILSRISLLQEKLRESLGNVASSLQTRLNILDEGEAKLAAQYSEQNDLALDLAKNALTFEHLANEVERHRKLFQVLVERMSEVQLSADYTKTNVEVVDEASVPKFPVKPNKQRMALFSLFLGLVLGIALAFLLEQVDDTIRTPEDLEMRVGVPVLGFVPKIDIKKQVDSRSAYRALICALEPQSSAIEAYRDIRTSLFFSSLGEKAKILLVTSAGPGDGKTTTASNLALTIAQSGKRVLLVDADFRRPSIHKIYGLDNASGLSHVLSGETALDDTLQKTVHDLNIIENLDIITAGPMPANPTELIESENMRNLLADTAARYDRVVIDTPPVLFVSDTSILSRICDGVILVVKSAKRTRAHALRAKKQLEKVGGKMVGGILNNVRVTRLSHYYSSYYYHGYARYRSDYYSSYYPNQDGKRGKTAARRTRE